MFLGGRKGEALTKYIKPLPDQSDEAKAVIYGWLAKDEKVFREDDIDWIAGRIHQLEILTEKLSKVEITDSKQIPIILDNMAMLMIKY